MEPVSNVLGIDKVTLDGKLIVIEERHDSNGNFILNSIILNALKKNYNVCFILFHSTFNHYHNVCMKFGYNLTILKEKGRIVVVEPMKTVAYDLERIHKETQSQEDENLQELAFNPTCILIQNLHRIIKNEYQKLITADEEAHCIIVVDDLSHLCNLGLSLNESVYFVRYLRSFVEYNNISQLCIVMHTYGDDPQSCASDTLAHSLKCMAHLFIAVDPLETGYSNDASGKLTINWRIDCVRKKYNWPEIGKYLFKLSDRQVKIYTPGTAILA